MINLAIASTTTLSALIALRKLAPIVGLIDKPNERKLHAGNIPLIGGLSISFALLIHQLLNPTIPNVEVFSLCLLSLAILGGFDDRFDLCFKVRLAVQAILAVVMIHQTGLSLSYLGNMFGFGVINSEILGYVLTGIGVIGAINAFNMLDGSDGLVGTVAIVTFSSLAIVFGWSGDAGYQLFCLVIIFAIIPFLLFNTGVLGEKRKVFMGDAGSMVIGFVVIWLLLLASQPTGISAMRPVTALWLIAIPLMDMTRVMCTRVSAGLSPFHPDRTHIHHVFQNQGLSKFKVVLLILALANGMSAFGLYGEVKQIPEPVMFYSFIGAFLLYLVVIRKLQN
ncbi:UDP-N-acetylglucosamine--undecaprenyl-phosphate N-acetylglucosaminephosphotransferase [Shewanella submarina]|uniref:Undecaprenyl-phosphate alpha-N-acetylglucosaminyl 1-phosphate transferase n=1 Tax=Shewanella submarina TaxID=2016376 RepID=A0ABV7GCY9_9GAMM|nr:UDP-N-acetylglucosamine--undecaprenyl-phosphate N-acetylglucosaminephosphotransferase [Shewanella submarina]MCL1037497.1 UDP-N-acetylglucosamine--undecaprenyl-phosphate N-acetylglucosaminephosphotransferase [Shewanella submarina]